jgi:hypothetical protein
MRHVLLLFLTALFLASCSSVPTAEQVDDFEASKKFILENETYMYVNGPDMQAHNDSVKILMDELRANDLPGLAKKYKLDKTGVDSYLLALSVSVNIIKANKTIDAGLKETRLNFDSIRRAIDSLWAKDSLEKVHFPPGSV